MQHLRCSGYWVIRTESLPSKSLYSHVNFIIPTKVQTKAWNQKNNAQKYECPQSPRCMQEQDDGLKGQSVMRNLFVMK